MNILFTNIDFDSRTGTETFVRDLAIKFHALGHYPMVYSPRIGSIADEIRNIGIPVVSNINDVPLKPDIIHGHHHIQAVSAFLHFPGIPGIYVCHDRLFKYDVPPLYKRIYFYVAVDYDRRERLVNSGIPDEMIRIIYNSVDTDRFLPRSPLPSYPKSALVFSNNASRSTYLQPIINVCNKLNIKFDVAGKASRKLVDQPEKILGNYDLVFAKGRCAMEAMVTGSAVILCDYNGLGSMVTIDEIEKLRQWNFGMHCLNQPIKEINIIQQINKYNPEEAKSVSNYMRKSAALSNMAKEYLNLYNQVLSVANDTKSEILNEFNAYINSLAAQVKKYEPILHLHKPKQLKWTIQDYVRHYIQLLYTPKVTLKKIIRRLMPSKISYGNSVTYSSLACYSRFRNQRNNINKMLLRISLAEKILLKHPSR